MTTIRIHPEAREEIDAAWRFYTRRDPAVGRRFMAAALQLLERVQEAPRQFPEHGLLAMPIGEQTLFFAVRRAVMPGPFPHVLFYYLRQGVPVVLAVAHGKRRPGYWAYRT